MRRLRAKSLIDRIGYSKSAWLLLLAEILLLFVTLSSCIAIECKYCLLRGTPDLVVLRRYFQVDEKSTFSIDSSAHQHTVSSPNVLLGMELSFAEECYCSDIAGVVLNYGSVDEGWLKAPREGGILRPTNGNVSVLEGEWDEPLNSGRVRIAIHIICLSDPNNVIEEFDFVTFQYNNNQ